MKCRRICRELLWLARFGEFGPSSQPHLDHLAGCRGCRDEVGFDRAMVEQLRIALARRIEDANPPSTAWASILARAQTPERPRSARLWEWSTAVVGRLRFATAMAGTGLALVLALNMEIVPIGPVTNDAAVSESEPTGLQQVPRMPVARNALADLTRQWTEEGSSGARRQDPEAQLTVVGRVQPPARGDRDDAVEEPVEQAPTTLRLVFRPMQTPDPGSSQARTPIETEGTATDRIDSEPGEPS